MYRRDQGVICIHRESSGIVATLVLRKICTLAKGTVVINTVLIKIQMNRMHNTCERLFYWSVTLIPHMFSNLHNFVPATSVRLNINMWKKLKCSKKWQQKKPNCSVVQKKHTSLEQSVEERIFFPINLNKLQLPSWPPAPNIDSLDRSLWSAVEIRHNVYPPRLSTAPVAVLPP